MAWGITFDFLPLLGSSHQDSWFCAKNGEATLAPDLNFFSFIWEREMGDPHTRTLMVRDPPFNVKFQGTHLDLPRDMFRSTSVLSWPSYKSPEHHAKEGEGIWRSRPSLGRLPYFLPQNRLIPLFLPWPPEFSFLAYLDSAKYLLFVMKIMPYICKVLNSSMQFPVFDPTWSSWEAAEQFHQVRFRCREKRLTQGHAASWDRAEVGIQGFWILV